MIKGIMQKTFFRLIVFALLLATAISFTGCSGNNSLVGEYTTTSGSCFLKLNKDGTCIYGEDDSTGTGTGTWYVEDDIIYIDVSNVGYMIYGDVSSFDGGILLEADSSKWIAEYFRQDD